MMMICTHAYIRVGTRKFHRSRPRFLMCSSWVRRLDGDEAQIKIHERCAFGKSKHVIFVHSGYTAWSLPRVPPPEGRSLDSDRFRPISRTYPNRTFKMRFGNRSAMIITFKMTSFSTLHIIQQFSWLCPTLQLLQQPKTKLSTYHTTYLEKKINLGQYTCQLFTFLETFLHVEKEFIPQKFVASWPSEG